MNRIPVLKSEKSSDSPLRFFITDNNKLEHINSILKLKSTKEIKLCIIDQGLALGKILSIDKKSALIEIIEEWPHKKSNQGPMIELLIGVSRPPTLKKILEHASTMGVSNFHFFKSELGDKSYLQSKVLKNEVFKKYLELGLAQSGVYYKMPEVKISKYNPTHTYKEGSNKFVLSLRHNKSFFDYRNQLDLTSKIVLAFGAERGLTSIEEDEFIENGFLPVSLGPSILRVEHAVFYALSQIEFMKNISNTSQGEKYE